MQRRDFGRFDGEKLSVAHRGWSAAGDDSGLCACAGGRSRTVEGLATVMGQVLALLAFSLVPGALAGLLIGRWLKRPTKNNKFRNSVKHFWGASSLVIEHEISWLYPNLNASTLTYPQDPKIPSLVICGLVP